MHVVRGPRGIGPPSLRCVLDAGQRRSVQDGTPMRVDRHGSIVPLALNGHDVL
jgi:hypothetical protein